MTRTDVAIEHLLRHCGGLRPNEDALLVVDATTLDLASRFVSIAKTMDANSELLEIPQAERHGVEPPVAVASRMKAADLVVGLTSKSLAHTQARNALSNRGGRYLSLAGYTEELLTDPSVMADFRGQLPAARAMADAFSNGSKVRVLGSSGTDITLDITGRVGNCCPGFVDEDYLLGSPPDIEANVSPIEDSGEGVVVVDGSVACDEIGLLEVPIVLEINGGHITRIQSSRPSYVDAVTRLFDSVGDSGAKVLAECGVGLNPLAILTGNMLTDEGTLGCVHFGFGSNATVGGKNNVPFHVDFVFRSATVLVDEVAVLKDGVPKVH